MYSSEKLVRFDWAIKRLLRNKADYCIVEGLLTALLGRKIFIKSLLESESNKETETDKFNRVDLLAEDESGDLYIFEIQNSRELDYFHRMAYGTSKCIAEYLKQGEPYEKIRKVYSINIVYFSLGQGKDYAYRGTTRFLSIHDDSEELMLSHAQREAFQCQSPSEIFPEYYLLRVDMFDRVATTPLDEWISFLKTGDIPTTASAPGLREARERLRLDLLGEEEKASYYRTMENLRYQRSVINTGRIEGFAEGRAEGCAEGFAKGCAEGLAKGRAEERFIIADKMLANGMPMETVAEMTGLSVEELKNRRL